MATINTEGLEIASLSSDQINILNNAQSNLNEMAPTNQEIYLLAVTRNKS